MKVRIVLSFFIVIFNQFLPSWFVENYLADNFREFFTKIFSKNLLTLYILMI